MKLLAFYLPQFHEIPENNDAWGNGFTEWVNVKKAKPLFWGHYQPRHPLNQNYYNLLDKNVMVQQMKLADKYGIGGFCFYHYWFKGKKVLEKPTEMILENPEAKLPFCFSWANEAWTKTWHGAGGEKEVLIRQEYGNRKDWEEHYEYLSNFFKDERYIKKDNKPVLLIYQIREIPCFDEMMECWNELAKKSGFDGIYIVSMLTSKNSSKPRKYIDGTVDFEPGKTRRQQIRKNDLLSGVKQAVRQKNISIPFLNRFLVNQIDYDSINQEKMKEHHKENEYRGVFVDYDDTPRRGVNGIVTTGSTPLKFEAYLTKHIEKACLEHSDFIFINAWNEWGESDYLEPDEKYGFAYLHSVRRALKANGVKWDRVYKNR